MLLIWFYVAYYSVKLAPFLFMEDSKNNSSFLRSTSCLLLVKRKWNHKFTIQPIFNVIVTQEGSAKSVRLFLFFLFVYLLFLFIFLFIVIFLTSTVITRGNWCWRHDNGRNFLPPEKLWLRLRKSCTSNKFFNRDLVLFIYLFGYLFIFSNVHSLFQSKLTLDTWWWN